MQPLPLPSITNHCKDVECHTPVERRGRARREDYQEYDVRKRMLEVGGRTLVIPPNIS